MFAPDNDAFANIQNLVSGLSSEQLTSILTYHVVQGTVGYSTSLSNGATLSTVQGGTVRVTVEDDGDIFVNSAEVEVANVLLSNGVAHVIDKYVGMICFFPGSPLLTIQQCAQPWQRDRHAQCERHGRQPGLLGRHQRPQRAFYVGRHVGRYADRRRHVHVQHGGHCGWSPTDSCRRRGGAVWRRCFLGQLLISSGGLIGWVEYHLVSGT